MSVFITAFSLLMPAEARYAHVDGDSGGETYCGVSRHNFPDWTGWAKVDAAKQARIDLNSDQLFQALQGNLLQFYNQNFWIPARAGEINSQALANFFFACCVNMGQHEAVKLLQRAAGLSQVDGYIGQNTLAAVNALPGTLEAYCNEVQSFYQALAANNPQDEKFLAGWIHRVDSYRIA